MTNKQPRNWHCQLCPTHAVEQSVGWHLVALGGKRVISFCPKHEYRERKRHLDGLTLKQKNDPFTLNGLTR